jgi:hypothetical protein
MTKTLSVCAAAAAALLISAASASAQVTTLTATLNGGEETPIVLTGAVATVVVSVDPTARELAVELRAFNLPTGTTAGHIHIAPRGIAGPVVIDFPIDRGVTGDFNQSFRIGAVQFHARPEIGINTLDDAIQAIVAGNSYANIHTTANPGGEMRGQLTVPQRTVVLSQEK